MQCTFKCTLIIVLQAASHFLFEHPGFLSLRLSSARLGYEDRNEDGGIEGKLICLLEYS